MSTSILEARATPDDVREAWDEIAFGYDEFVTPSHFWLGAEGLRRAGLRNGMAFLDVAAGTGALSVPAARLGARVVATDLAPEMLERLEARARREGLALETEVMDGHALSFDDATFDVVGSQFGVMLFPDQPRALREMARVTRPGGRVLMTVYGNPSQVEFLSVFIGAVRTVDPDFRGLPAEPPPLPFQAADPEVLRRRMAGAGLRDVQIETIREELRFRSGAELWDWVINSNPIPAQLVGHLGPEELAGVREALEAEIGQRAGNEGPAVLTNPVHVGVGTR